VIVLVAVLLVSAPGCGVVARNGVKPAARAADSGPNWMPKLHAIQPHVFRYRALVHSSSCFVLGGGQCRLHPHTCLVSGGVWAQVPSSDSPCAAPGVPRPVGPSVLVAAPWAAWPAFRPSCPRPWRPRRCLRRSAAMGAPGCHLH